MTEDMMFLELPHISGLEQTAKAVIKVVFPL